MKTDHSGKHYAEPKEAEEILVWAQSSNPGRWIGHSKYTGLACRLIAEHCPDMDPEKAYTAGLLHDIGRYVGVVRGRHQIEGYRICMERGWDANARICLTHSQVLKDLTKSLDYWDISEEDFEFFNHYIQDIEFDDYDLLVQLGDCLALPSGFCIIEKRMIDVARRYGVNNDSVARWNKIFELKDYFNRKTGLNIYRFLPNIEENTII